MAVLADADLGVRVRARRRERGMSRVEVARRIGVPVSRLRDYECGREHIGAAALSAISHALHVPPLALFAEDPEPARRPRDDDAVCAEDLRAAEADRTRLVRAFSRIEDRDVRLSVISLLEAISRSGTVPEDLLEQVVGRA